MANHGGTNDYGTVFAVNTDGTGFTTLHLFTGGSDGVSSESPLVLSGQTLYGTALDGGTNAMDAEEVAPCLPSIRTARVLGPSTLLATFSSSPPSNSDGANPSGELVLSGNTLYGTTLDWWHERVAALCLPLRPTALVLGNSTHLRPDSSQPSVRLGPVRQHSVRNDAGRRHERQRHGVCRKYGRHGFYDTSHLSRF